MAVVQVDGEASLDGLLHGNSEPGGNVFWESAAFMRGSTEKAMPGTCLHSPENMRG